MSTFPQPWISTVSHWQATNRGPDSLWLHNKEAPLPETADVVIIGAGMAGSALSYFLTRENAFGAGKKVVCVEAKDVGSGASGRNGGHVGPKTYHKWDLLMQPYPVGMGCSEEEATWVMQNERDNLDLVEEIVKKEGLDVDFWRGELIETHHSAEQTAYSKDRYAKWMAAREKLGLKPNPETRFIDDPKEAEKVSRFKDVTSIHIRPGGSVHSHKLCTAMMRMAIESKHSDFSFYSWAPVDGFPTETSDGKWVVKTSRGSITTTKVVLCTNAHTQNFFPKGHLLHNHIQPYRGQCSLITPPPTYSGAQALKNTYNMKHESYIVQTPMGGIVFGGGLHKLVEEGKFDLKDAFDQVDDSGAALNPELTKFMAGFMKENFVGWGEEGYGEGLTRTWCGILSAVKDWVPLVGEIPGKKGVSMTAGYAGHGMSRIFVVARAWAEFLKTEKWDEALLPRSFELTQERLDRTAKAQADWEAIYGTDARVVNGSVTRNGKKSKLNGDAEGKSATLELEHLKVSDGDSGVKDSLVEAAQTVKAAA